MAGKFVKALHFLGLLDLYYWLRRPNFGGSHSRSWWETRDKVTSSAESYWSRRNHPSRMAIARVIAALPGTSLLEVGTHAGPTLWAIAQRRQFHRLAGTELSPVILQFARKHLPEALGRDVELANAAADSLPFADKSFDIVVSAAVLACIGPELILESLDEMLRVCRGYLVLAESFSNNPRLANPRGRKERYPNTSYWVRNYPGLLKGRAELVDIVHLSPEEREGQGHLSSVMVFKPI